MIGALETPAVSEAIGIASDAEAAATRAAAQESDNNSFVMLNSPQSERSTLITYN